MMTPELGSHGSFHTPGPWRLIYDPERAIFGGVQMGRDGGFMVRGDHADANTRLIAAAPDLYAALVRARSALQANEDTGAWELYQHSPEMLAIDAAIAKAEGRE